MRTVHENESHILKKHNDKPMSGSIHEHESLYVISHKKRSPSINSLLLPFISVWKTGSKNGTLSSKARLLIADFCWSVSKGSTPNPTGSLILPPCCLYKSAASVGFHSNV